MLDAGADLIHFDVMDNHYVPNLTVGPVVCQALRRYGIQAPIDVHLMVRPVDRIVPDFAAAGATYISFHPEASDHVDRTIHLIREHGCRPGLVFNPATPLDWLDYTLEKLDLVLLMSVNPGFAGQQFIPSVLDKIREVHRRIRVSGRPVRVEVDVASRSITSRRSWRRAPIRSWPVRPSSAAATMRRRSAPCARRSRAPRLLPGREEPLNRRRRRRRVPPWSARWVWRTYRPRRRRHRCCGPGRSRAGSSSSGGH